MEKELFILGIIRRQKVHGYRLWELLEAVPTGIRLKRSNAYRILDSLAKRGWISRDTEREGNRPERYVYGITGEGEAAFTNMIRSSLEDNAEADLPNAVALHYLDTLPPNDVVELLERRRASVQARISGHGDLSEEALRRHPGVAFAVGYDRFELDFLSRLIASLNAAAVATPSTLS